MPWEIQAWYCQGVSTPGWLVLLTIATWDGAKNPVNHRRNYQPQLVSWTSEPSTLVPEHDAGFVFSSFSEINSISIPQIHSVGRCWPSLQEKLKCVLCFVSPEGELDVMRSRVVFMGHVHQKSLMFSNKQVFCSELVNLARWPAWKIISWIHTSDEKELDSHSTKWTPTRNKWGCDFFQEGWGLYIVKNCSKIGSSPHSCEVCAHPLHWAQSLEDCFWYMEWCEKA